MNIGLAIDKKLGVESKVVGTGKSGTSSRAYQSEKTTTAGNFEIKEAQNKWNGWGSCLKPSFEPIIIARKPFKGSLTDNVLKYGVGGLNIDECRVGNEERTYKGAGGSNITIAKGSIGSGAGRNLEFKATGRFPANTILTYDEENYEEVCGGFPNTKPAGNKIGKDINKNLDYNASSYKFSNNKCPKIEGDEGGSASRYFKNCKYSRKDEEIWKNIYANTVAKDLKTIQAIKENIVQTNVEDLLKELKDHYAKYVESQSKQIEIYIVQDIVKILNWDFKIETSQVIQDFITNYKKCIQFHNLVKFVEEWDNIDTTPTTRSLLKLFGYVKAVIINYILESPKLEQKRYLYVPKASKKDRDEGLEEFEEKRVGSIAGGESNKEIIDDVSSRFRTYKKNVHPTVKPTNLMQYLVRLVTPNGGTVLDPFNGSGSTGKAVMYENLEHNKEYKYIGIELTEEYLPISQARIEYVINKGELK